MPLFLRRRSRGPRRRRGLPAEEMGGDSRSHKGPARVDHTGSLPKRTRARRGGLAGSRVHGVAREDAKARMIR